MSMHGFTVLVLIALLAAPASAARPPALPDDVSLESWTGVQDDAQSSAARHGGAHVQKSTVARQEGTQLHNSTAAGPEGWVQRKVREAWGQGDLHGRVLQAAARHVSAGASMLQDSERLGANLSGHAMRIATSGVSVLQHGAGHLLKLGRGGSVAPGDGAVNTKGKDPEKDPAAVGDGPVNTKGKDPEEDPAAVGDGAVNTTAQGNLVEQEIEKDLGASPQQVKSAEKEAMGGPAMQIIFALVYFFLIAQTYPKVPEGVEISPEVKEFQQKGVLAAPFSGACENAFLALFCPVARAAHTMDAAGIMGYWFSCLAMTFFPCPTLWLAHSCSDLQAKLGTDQRGCIMDCLCVTFCTCCVITQDAIALDMITGARTGICGVTPPPVTGQ